MYHRGDPICQIMHRDDKFLLQRIRRYWRPWEIPEYEPHFLQRGSYSHSKGTSQSRPQNLTDSWINVLKGSHNREFFYCCIVNCGNKAKHGAHIEDATGKLAVVPMCPQCHRMEKGLVGDDTPCIIDDDIGLVPAGEIEFEEFCRPCMEITPHKENEGGRKYCTQCSEYSDEYDD